MEWEWDEEGEDKLIEELIDEVRLSVVVTVVEDKRMLDDEDEEEGLDREERFKKDEDDEEAEGLEKGEELDIEDGLEREGGLDNAWMCDDDGMLADAKEKVLDDDVGRKELDSVGLWTVAWWRSRTSLLLNEI